LVKPRKLGSYASIAYEFLYATGKRSFLKGGGKHFHKHPSGSSLNTLQKPLRSPLRAFLPISYTYLLEKAQKAS